MISPDGEELLDDSPLFTLLQTPSVYTTEPNPTTSVLAHQPVNKNSQIKRSRVDAITSPEKRARFETTKYILAKSGLLEITKETALLIKENQDAQEELMELKNEISIFIQSVLDNPANQNRSKQATNAFLMNPLNDTKPPHQHLPKKTGPVGGGVPQPQLSQTATTISAGLQQHNTLHHQSYMDDNMAASPKVSVIKQHSSSQPQTPTTYQI